LRRSATARRWGGLSPTSTRPTNTDNVVVLTDAYWRQRLNADPQVIGRQIRVKGVEKAVIGVLPPDYCFLSSEARLYFPLSSSPENRTPERRHSGGNSTHRIARLKPGVSVGEAQSQIDAQNATLEADDPEAKMIADAGFRSIVTSLRADHVAAIRPALLVPEGSVFVLLLIGVVNLVNRLLIRANGRVKELALRQALGASRRHIVSEVMVETILLTFVGALTRLRRRGSRDSFAGQVRFQRFAAGRFHRLRFARGIGRFGRGHRDWNRAGDADCVVQLEPHDQGVAIGVAGRNIQSGRGTPAAWIHDRPGCACVRVVNGSGMARAQP
jgi:hypothetical protein